MILKRCLVLLFLVISAIINGNAQTVLRNLVQNPSFEYTGRDTVRVRPDESWTFKADRESVTGHATTSRSIDGFRSYLIRAENGRGYLESDPFDVQRFQDYLFSFAVCGNGQIQVEVKWWREQNETMTLLNKQYLDTITIEENWIVPQFRVTAPRRASTASVRFIVSGGQAWIDDVRFR